MNLSSDVIDAYEKAKPSIEELRNVIDNMFSAFASQAGGRYIPARIKPLESVVAKAEKDAPASLFRDIEDWLAATIVLTSRSKINKLEEQIKEYCDILSQKSERQDDPERFMYDDRQLVLQLKGNLASVQEKPALRNFTFEVQIKTHFQYALSQWSRDAYKTRKLSWGLARLISQTRALVEMADAALARIEENLLEPESNTEYKKFARQNAIIEIFQSRLDPFQLPEDMRRLAVTIDEELKNLYKNQGSDAQLEALKNLLDDPTNQDILQAQSLTAYNIAFIALFRANKASMTSIQNGQMTLIKGKRTRLLITREILAYCPELRQLSTNHRIDISVPET